MDNILGLQQQTADLYSFVITDKSMTLL